MLFCVRCAVWHNNNNNNIHMCTANKGRFYTRIWRIFIYIYKIYCIYVGVWSLLLFNIIIMQFVSAYSDFRNFDLFIILNIYIKIYTIFISYTYIIYINGYASFIYIIYIYDVYMCSIFSVISLFNGLKNVCIFSGFFVGFLYIRIQIPV